MDEKLSRFHIPQISGFWKGLLTCIASSILVGVVQHSDFHSWSEVWPALSSIALDSLKMVAAWILLQSPFKPKDPPKSN